MTVKTVGVGGKVRRVGKHFGAAYWTVFVAVAGYDVAFMGAAVSFSAVAAFAFISCHH